MQNDTIPCGGAFSLLKNPPTSNSWGKKDQVSKKKAMNEYFNGGYPKMVLTHYEIKSLFKEVFFFFLVAEYLKFCSPIYIVAN